MSPVSPVAAFRRCVLAIVAAVILGAGASCDDTSPLAINTGPAIMLSPLSASLAVGDSAVFRATVSPAGSLRWTSSAPTVVAVSALGVVRGLAPGRATITVGPVARPNVAASALVEVHAP
jgi:uncharacterized protein YjdB